MECQGNIQRPLFQCSFTLMNVQSLREWQLLIGG